ncbi:MAG: hypothetical protein WCO43_09905 [Chitinophagia bacterium]
MNKSKYIVSVEFSPNKNYNNEKPEKLYIKTPLGNMLNPELSQKLLLQLHDLASIIDEIYRISISKKHVTSKQTFNTELGRLEINVKTVGKVFNLFQVLLLTLLTASIVFVLSYLVIK